MVNDPLTQFDPQPTEDWAEARELRINKAIERRSKLVIDRRKR